MRAVVQRVHQAHVMVEDVQVGAIQTGLLVLLAVKQSDTPAEVKKLADKLLHLRLFPGPHSSFDQSLKDGAGTLLVVSQFTLYGETRKGRRPSWAKAAPPTHAEPLIMTFVDYVQSQGVLVATGTFGAHMDVALVNDGPVTLVLDTDEWAAGYG